MLFILGGDDAYDLLLQSPDLDRGNKTKAGEVKKEAGAGGGL